ncbi:MAG: sugar porter family MFS transporter [Chlamydiota bacterium]
MPVLVIMFVSILPFLLGYHSSIIAGALIPISHEFRLTFLEEGGIVSIFLLGALFGSAVGGFCADKIGRKKTLFLATILFIFGNLFLFFAVQKWDFWMGRWWIGFGAGLTSIAVPLYFSEVIPNRYRSMVLSGYQLSITIGILIGYCVGYFFISEEDWRTMVGFSFFLETIVLCSLFWMPETPIYLLEKDEKKAEEIYRKMGFLEKEKISKKVEELFTWKKYIGKGLFGALGVGILLSLFQQVTGINTVIYYAPMILLSNGVPSPSYALLITMGIGVVNVLMTIWALFLVVKMKRKTLLLIGLWGMFFSLTLLSFSSFLPKPFLMGSVIIYVAFFAVSLGPLLWVIATELYPPKMRGEAMSIIAAVNWLSNYGISFSFLSLLNFLGNGKTFFLYSCMTLLAIFFVWKKLPETKGQSWEHIWSFWKKSS